MGVQQITQLNSFDTESFTTLCRALGYHGLACYRLYLDTLTLVAGSALGEKAEWPVAVGYHPDYTARARTPMHVGWERRRIATDQGVSWPKNLHFYLPMQDQYLAKLVFAVRLPPGRRVRHTDLDGGLEALARRISFTIESADTKFFISETSFDQLLGSMARSLIDAIDHDVRNPLASITGLVESLDAGADAAAVAEVRAGVSKQIRDATSALDRIGMALHSTVSLNDKTSEGQVNLRDLIAATVGRARSEGQDLLRTKSKVNLTIIPVVEEQVDMHVQGVADLISRALWEVVKNAIMFSAHGVVRVNGYRSDRSVVIDIEDDGEGIVPGTEDVIFLRFYQEVRGRMHSKSARPGLGLGLFLAREIAERHLGQLLYVRDSRGKGRFRFIFAGTAKVNSGAPTTLPSSGGAQTA